jgi:hypothetical protein
MPNTSNERIIVQCDDQDRLILTNKESSTEVNIFQEVPNNVTVVVEDSNRLNDPDPEIKVVVVEENSDTNTIIVQQEPLPKILSVITAGPPGQSGERGPRGFSGSVPPFFLIEGTENYETTSSLVFNAPISSSFYPTGVFDLGEVENPWNALFITGSIIFSNGSEELLVISSSIENELYIGDLVFTTRSIGFKDDPIVIKEDNTVKVRVTGSIKVRNDSNETVLSIQSSSITTHTFDNKGRLVFHDFERLPSAVEGAIVFSGSCLFVGI